MRWLIHGPVRFAGAWLAVVALTFALIRGMPGDPIEIFLASAGTGTSDAVVADYRALWGMDRPLSMQFAAWLGGFVQLDWGASFQTGQPIFGEFVARLPWSLCIGCGGLGLAILTGGALGFAAAARPGGSADAASRALAVGAQALPAFAVGLVLLWLLAVEWRLIHPMSGSLAERLALPIVLVALFSVGSVARVTRTAFAETAARPWYVTAMAKGLTRRQALWRHGRRHAALTVLATVAPEAAWAIGGTAVAEVVFGIPGLSDRVVTAVAARDYPVLQAFVAVVALWILSVHLVADTTRRRLDPHIGP